LHDKLRNIKRMVEWEYGKESPPRPLVAGRFFGPLPFLCNGIHFRLCEKKRKKKKEKEKRKKKKEKKEKRKEYQTAPLRF